jgi:hypothetical protein
VRVSDGNLTAMATYASISSPSASGTDTVVLWLCPFWLVCYARVHQTASPPQLNHVVCVCSIVPWRLAEWCKGHSGLMHAMQPCMHWNHLCARCKLTSTCGSVFPCAEWPVTANASWMGSWCLVICIFWCYPHQWQW